MSEQKEKKVVKKKVGEKKVVKKATTGEKKSEKKGEKKVTKKVEKKEDKKEEKKEKKEHKDEIKIATIVPSYKPAGFDECDWSKREAIIALFPQYVQLHLAARGKPLSKTVDIFPFSLKAPLSASYLLYDAQLLLEANKKQALIGDAGCGKSTLFSELAKGSIKDFPKHLYVHHCKEIEISDHAISVIDTVVRAHEYRNTLLECQIKLQQLIDAKDPAPSKSDLGNYKDNLDYVSMLLRSLNSDTAYDRASKMLRVLGFDEEGQKKSTNALSGGLRMRVALCAAFFIEPDLLLLDEPTNHLDFPSVLWLENRLRAYRGSFVMVSHDRNLLNNTCTSAICMEDKQLFYHACGFAEFEKKREKAHKKKADDIDKFLAKYRNVDFSSPLAKEKAEKKAWSDMWAQRQVLLAGKFTFPDAVKLVSTDPSIAPESIPLIDVKNVTFSYNIDTGIWIFKDPINITITASSRIGVMGPNGAGKSTFLKLITDKLRAVSGEITRHSTAKVAYFAQHHVMDLDLNTTPIECMIDAFPEEKPGQLRSHLAKVGIVGEKAETRMAGLSGGLRSCVCFAKITYFCPHLLIMDEPTNFLDLESIDALIAATNKYKGALLLVSHNRAFLLKCAKQYLSVVPGKFLLFDDLKTCERSTYQFIEEMESGVKVGAQDLVAKNPSADAALSVRTGAAAAASAAREAALKKDSDGAITISSTPAPKPVAKTTAPTVIPPEEKELVGKKCIAVWAADGGKYPATITKALGKGMIEVQYTGYPDKASVKIKEVVIKK